MTSATKEPYNEFGLFHENIAEYGLTVSPQPVVTRIEFELEDARRVSALRWGAAPEIAVFDL